MQSQQKIQQKQISDSGWLEFLIDRQNPDELCFQTPLHQHYLFKNDKVKSEKFEMINEIEQSTFTQSKIPIELKIVDKINCQLLFINEERDSMESEKKKSKNVEKKEEKNFIEKIVPVLKEYLNIENHVKKKRRGTKRQLLSIINEPQYEKQLANFFIHKNGERQSLLLNSFSIKEISKEWKKVRERYITSLKQGRKSGWSQIKSSQPILYS